MPRLFFIGGSGRCGTTLLYRALREHPRVALTNEARVVDFLVFAARLAALPDDTCADFEFEEPQRLRGVVTRAHVDTFAPLFAEHARRMVAEFYERSFPGRDHDWFGDKMPLPIAALEARLLFPDARFVVLVRDPRDYLCSARAYARRADIAASYPHLDVPVRSHLEHWRNVYAGLRAHLPGVVPIRYEELVEDPEQGLRAALAVLELEPHPACLQTLRGGAGFEAHATASSPRASVGRWRGELEPEEVRLAESICGAEMAALGYPLSLGD